MHNMLMSRVHIKVTRKLIRESWPRCISRCAVAEAIRPCLKIQDFLPIRVMVSSESVTLQTLNAIYTFNTTKRMARFIWQFDTDKRKCRPTGFYLYLPVQLLKQEYIKQCSSKYARHMRWAMPVG